jgi:tetratricopeptide (TPR) repeat protein
MAKVSLRAYNREIETMIDRGQLDEAIAHCHHIFKTFPKHLETYRLLGKAYLEYKRYGDTVDIFTRVLVSVPNDFVANVGMSIIRDEENKLDDAIWHMERAFEVQPSNPAIQSELQRLYGRRDGVAPPRIRMTRGALAHMYVQGELYPQAISEIKSVLKEDGGRSDMQALLARAHYRSGQKNEAAEVASSLLRRYPYCLDANRVLAEILSTDRPENAKAYRDRVVELDPYAAQVNGTLFQSNEVPDQAVSLEHLDWNGQPVGASTQADWRETRAISTGSLGAERNEQPDWLKNAAAMDNAPTVHPQPKAGAAFEAPATPVQPAQPTPSDQIPDFLREAGWGQSTGTFDESKSTFAEEQPVSSEQPLAQGDLPDWVKAMAPKEEAQPPAEEEMPDWINNIKPSSVAGATTAAAQTDDDWLNQLAQPSQPAERPADDQMDWMKGFETSTPPASDDQPDWLKGLGSETPAQASEQPDWLSGLGSESQTPAQPSEQPDWLKGLGEETPSAEPSAQPSNQPDWMKGLDNEASVPSQADEMDWLKGLGGETLSAPKSEEPDWLQGLGEETPAAAPQAEESDWLKQFDVQPQQPESKSEVTDFSFLDELTAEPAQEPPAAAPPPAIDTGKLGTSQQEIDDSLAWLENLAAKQGATEGLLTKPEERLEQEPEWVKQAKGVSTPPPAQQTQPPAEPVSVPQTSPEKVEDLGKSQSEIDDSLAWLEALAAKQGATEGLLIKPEERHEQEPEWVKKVKGTTGPLSEQKAPEVPTPPVEEAAAEPLPVEQPVAKVEDLGKSQREIDDSLAWLEGLAAKQGATEGLLTKPEERLEAEPEWVKQAKSAPETPAQPVEASVEQPASEPVSAVDDTAAWLKNLEEEETRPEIRSAADETAMWLRTLDEEKPSAPEETESAADETAMWLRTLDEEQPPAPASTETTADETAMWLKSLDEAESASEPVQSAQDELPAWMQATEEEKPSAPEPAVPEEEAVESVEEPVAQQETPKVEEENLPSWLSDLEKEEEQAEVSLPAAQDDLPAWLRDQTGEVVAEPTKIEPTRPTDWKPVEAKREETPVPPPPVEEVRPEPKPEPKPVKKAPTKTEVRPMTPPEPYKEPVTRRGTGMLTMPTDPILHTARTELSRSNIPGALETYGKLIKKGRFLDEVIFDLREALYRYPVEVSIWQSLGDAYMRANRLQDALDAYTKAEELLR